MRYGFSVCANACRCQAVLPAMFFLSPTFTCRFATVLFSFVTLAAKFSTSPVRGENGAGSTAASLFGAAVLPGGLGAAGRPANGAWEGSTTAGDVKSGAWRSWYWR